MDARGTSAESLKRGPSVIQSIVIELLIEALLPGQAQRTARKMPGEQACPCGVAVLGRKDRPSTIKIRVARADEWRKRWERFGKARTEPGQFSG